MSAVPKKQPQRTRVLVKDLIFQETYRLTDTQVDIMSYIFNALTWAKTVMGYMPLTTKKFRGDLPQIGEKTLEASLLVLKKMELIEVDTIVMVNWHNARVRGIKITPKGMKYNSSFYSPNSQEVIENLEKELHRVTNELKEIKISQENQEVQVQEVQVQEVQVEEYIQEERIEQTEQVKIVDIKPEIVEIKVQEVKVEEIKELPKEEDLQTFIDNIKIEFGRTSDAICNGANGWLEEVEFYINSYNKLMVVVPSSGNQYQLNDPIEINKFWKWLFNNQDKVGILQDFSKLDGEILTPKYKNIEIRVNDRDYIIENIITTENGVKIMLLDENDNIIPIEDNNSNNQEYPYHAFHDLIDYLKI